MYLKNLALVVNGVFLPALLVLLMSTKAMPQHQTEPLLHNPEQQVQGEAQPQTPSPAIVQTQVQPQSENKPTAEMQAQAHQPAQPQGQPPTESLPLMSATNLTTQMSEHSPNTANPYRMATGIPDKDSNKDILDYSDALLADLQFSPPPAAPSSANYLNEYTISLVNRYHDHEQLYADLLQLSQHYPRLTRLYDIGTSVESRKLWVLEISESPGKHEPLKPEFRYIANMHGNDVVGRELLLHLARLILENYYAHDDQLQQQDPDKPTGSKFIRKLVKATRIHLMPTMNPDGFVRSSVSCKHERPSQKGRLNANNIDLNRNFPNKELGTQADAGTQPEVRAIMEWSKQVPFVLSASMHGGAMVAVIPYDSARSRSTIDMPDQRRCPDHDTFMDLARAYTRSHLTMSKGQICYDRCSEEDENVFPNDGITVGSEWHQFYGSMKDWIYDYTNEFHLTLKIGCNQYPPAESLIQYWNMNKVAMLNFMRQIHKGIKGMVEDATTGQPLANVNVHVRNISHNITTTQAGDYFRLLAPGMYRVLFEHPGYQSEEILVTLRDTMAQIHNIRLKQIGQSPGDSPTRPGDVMGGEGGPQDAVRPIAVATLIMSIITVALLLFLAGAYVIQRRRFKRSQSVSIELQPTGRSNLGTTTTANLSPLKSTSTSANVSGISLGAARM